MAAKYRSLKNKDILLASNAALKELGRKFPTAENYEKLVQCFLFGYFHGRGLKMEMEYKIPESNQRVDFRFRDRNQALLELAAIRKRKKGKYGWEALPSVNQSELRKLMNISRGKAKRKILLILDFHSKEHKKIDLLRQAYWTKWKELLKVKRNKDIEKVSVLYVHGDGAKYSVTLSPKNKGKVTSRDLSNS